MFRVTDAPDDPDALLLLDPSADSAVRIVPKRGGIVARFRVGAREVLYLDEATLADPSKNVRGGVPVLFPIAGRLTGDSYRVGERAFALKQHGFARNLPWLVDAQCVGNSASVSLALEASPETLAAFPWAFRVRITFELRGPTLTLWQTYSNDSDTPMPLHAGFHPYFFVAQADKAKTVIETDATRAFDNTTKTVGPVGAIDLTRPEVDLHLLDHRSRTARLRTPDGRAVLLRTEGSFKTLVVWTLVGKDFVCLEPWTAPADALNTGDGVITVAPHGALGTHFSITAE